MAFTVLDRRLHLVDEPLFPDNEYTANFDRIIPAMLGLANLIESRRPPAGCRQPNCRDGLTRATPITSSSMTSTRSRMSPATSGPYIGQRPWTPIIRLLSQAAIWGCG